MIVKYYFTNDFEQIRNLGKTVSSLAAKFHKIPFSPTHVYKEEKEYSLPTFVLLDSKGAIVSKLEGTCEESVVAKWLNDWIDV